MNTKIKQAIEDFNEAINPSEQIKYGFVVVVFNVDDPDAYSHYSSNVDDEYAMPMVLGAIEAIEHDINQPQISH